MVTSAIRRTPMPARISRGLSRSGRRPLGASGGPLDRFGVMVVAVAGITCNHEGTKTRRSSSLLLDVQEVVQLAHELVDVAEMTIHRRETDVRHFVEFL